MCHIERPKSIQKPLKLKGGYRCIVCYRMTQESKWSSGSRKGMGMDDLLRWKKCNIVVANFHVFKNLHPLTFGVSAEHAGALNAEEDSFIGCLKWQPTLNANVIAAQNQLIMVETLSEQDIATLCHVTGTCKGGNILLYASEISIRHYGLNSVTSAGFRIRHSNTVTLSKVLLCSKTDESYEWVQSENWCTDLFLNSCQKPILCRQGDVCMFPLRSSVNDLATYERESEHRFNLVVVDSQPVRQGIIGHSTEITIVKSDFLLKPPMEKKQQEGERERFEAAAGPATTLNSVSCFNGLLKWLFILLLQYGIASRKMKPIQMAIGWFAFGFKIASSWRARLNIQILPKPPFRLHCKELFDPHQVIFVTSKFLLQYELSDLSWIVVMLQCQESRYQKRAVRLCAVEKHLDFIDISVFGCLQDSVAYITPQLWFNLNPQPSRLIQPDTILLLQKYGSTRTTWENKPVANYGPLYANEVRIKLIKSPNYDVSINCDDLLFQYFSLPRLLCQGDVFCLKGSDIGNLFSSSDIGCKNAVYFYVAEVQRRQQPEPEGCLVDCLHSTMHQTGTMQTYVPTSMETYFSDTLLHPIWNSPAPRGFEKTCAELLSITFPYLQSRKLRSNAFPSLCVFGPNGCGKTLVAQALANQLNIQVCIVNCWELIGDTSGATEARIRALLQKASSFAPCLIILKNVHAICRDSDGTLGEARVIQCLKEALSQLYQTCDDCPVLLVGITTDINLLTPDLANLFLHNCNIGVPAQDVRCEILQVLINDVSCGLQVSITDLVQKTSGFVLSDLCALVSNAVSVAYRRIGQLRTSDIDNLSAEDEDDLCIAGVQLLRTDFEEAMAAMQAAHSDAVGAPKIPDVKWEDIGGLEYAKQEILDTVQLPLQHPELLASGLRRSGILLYGPPGTGKTLLAKAVATECCLNFLSIKGPELINMYVGQSEENVRKVFQKARNAAPCIIFFDELDSLAPNRGRSGDSGGVMDRVVSQLLAELDGMQQSMDVFVMGATNRPDLLDSALLRPGRFDKLVYVGISSDRATHLKILKALTRKMHLSDDVALSEFVDHCPSHLTGADFYALCSDAVLHAMSDIMKELELEHRPVADIVVSRKDFDNALLNFIPSTSSEELRRYEEIQRRLQRN